MVHLYGLAVGGHAIVVGAEPTGYAAVETLRQAGTETVTMVTDLPRSQAGAVRAQGTRLLRGVPLLRGATVTELLGRPRLTGLRLRHHDGRTTTLGCDTVVFTGDFVPDHELARHGGLLLDPGTRGPAVDPAFRTSHEGVFAAGSVLHAAESAGTAAREGALTAQAVLRHLAGSGGPGPDAVPVRAEPPLSWIAPNRVTPDVPATHGFLLRTTRFLTRPTLLVTQDGRPLHVERHRRTAVPHRPVRLSGDWTTRVDTDGGAVRVMVR
jgi:NADPH-dependent 2,4-dienoyl-CoA reductase/sulfur reductase-like enzyme